MQVFQKLTDELYSQVRMQMKDFSLLQQIDKQLQNILKKEIVETSSLNEVSKISSKLLDIYFTLEEEYELEVYKISDEALQMKNEADEIALDFAFKVGNQAIGLINYCFKMSFKSKDIYSRFTKGQLEDLLIININYSRKLLDFTEAKKYDEFITQTCENNQLILDLLSDQLENDDNLQNMKFCNEFNLLEIKALNPKISFTDILNHSKDILAFFEKYPQLENSKKNTIENMLCILFQQVQDCQIKKVDELLSMIKLHPILLQTADISYQAHYLKLNIVNALEHKDKSLVDQLEDEIYTISYFDPSDFFFLILNIRKLKLNSDEKSIQKILKFIEEYQIKYKPITSYELSQLLFEICNIDTKFIYIAFSLYQKHILSYKHEFIQENRITDSFYDILTTFSQLIDEFFSSKDSKKQIESILETFRDCLKQLVGIVLSAKKLTMGDIINQQAFYQRVCKLILEVTINLKDINTKPLTNTLEIIEIFILLLKKQQKDNAQHQVFIDEISCIGLICAIKANNPKYIKDFSHNILDSFNFLPQILLSLTKKEQIPIQDFQKYLTYLMRQSGQPGKEQFSDNQNLIHLFAFKNLLNHMDNDNNLLEFYINFVDQNFEEYFFFFRKNFIENYLERQPDISIATPFVRKVVSLKQNLAQNVVEIQDTTKMLFVIIEKFYQHFSTQDSNVPLSILITDSERKEIIEIMQSYFCSGNISSDPRVGCKFLHYIVLYSSLELVFDNTEQSQYFEGSYLNQCIYKINFLLNNKIHQCNLTPSQSSLFQNPYFLRSLILLYCYQVIFYELSLKSSSLPQKSVKILENLIESYELTSINLMDYLYEIDSKLVNDNLKNQFLLFQFIFSILQNNMTKCLSIIEIFIRDYPNQLELLSQISKIKQSQDLVQIINKKYIYYISSKNYDVEHFSSNLIYFVCQNIILFLQIFIAEIIMDLVEQIDNTKQFESIYIPVKMILKKVIGSNNVSPSQFETIFYIIKELNSKLSQINPNHPEIQELNQLQKRVRCR